MGAGEGAYLMGAGEGAYLMGAGEGAYLMGAGEGAYLMRLTRVSETIPTDFSVEHCRLVEPLVAPITFA